MPRRDDIHRILILGSGPIVIGQAAEFDYSGTQACKALREEGYEVILVNSNPATIMTDPELANRTYIEPVTPDLVEKVIARERPDALLPTMGGQTGLNVALELHARGVLEKYGVTMLAASPEVIHKAEDREAFRTAMLRVGLDLPRSRTVKNFQDALVARDEIGLPCVIRPSFTLGGTGGGIAFNVDEFDEICRRGLDLSPTTEVLIEESVIGWKEFELEVMRDRADNVVIICSIENIDPMGVHTGDSITVAPAQTLSDREYQRMRDAAIRVIREIGVETGGSNIQFAVDPATGRMVVIEMNPRVSRSSALASKATGFPIAKIAAKLAVGYTLDELPNDITRKTLACFEPTIDYVVTKAPRFNFEKFPEADAILTTQMRSVGEAMAIGRTFRESFQKALRSLETGRFGFAAANTKSEPLSDRDLKRALQKPSPERIFRVREAFVRGWSVEDVAALTLFDPWFLEQMRLLRERELELAVHSRLEKVPNDLFLHAKQDGFSDQQIGRIFGRTEWEVRAERQRRGIRPVYKIVDTCAAEFEAETPYYYSTYDEEDELRPAEKERIVILGGGPNRIGQGVEFDYCCVQAAYRAARRRLRDGDGQLQPGDRLDRLRHIGRSLLRAADDGARARSDRAHGAQRRDRAVRGADAPEPGARPRAGRRADHRHVARLHRPRGRPRSLQGPRRAMRAPAAQQRHGHGLRRRAGGGAQDRLSGPGAAVLRSRRPGDGDRLRRRHAQAVHGGGRGGLAGEARPHRQVPRGRRRDRRRLRVPTARARSSAGSWSTSRRPESTPATRAARSPRSP